MVENRQKVTAKDRSIAASK